MEDAGKTDIYLSSLEDLAEGGSLTDDQEDAVEHAQDAITFCQSLWSLFGDQALHDDGPDPDFDKMEHLVDALNGEIAAAVLFLCNNADASSQALNITADSLEKVRSETVNEADNVPQIVIEGNRRLARRIKNTKVILNAKRVTRMIPE